MGRINFSFTGCCRSRGTFFFCYAWSSPECDSRCQATMGFACAEKESQQNDLRSLGSRNSTQTIFFLLTLMDDTVHICVFTSETSLDAYLRFYKPNFTGTGLWTKFAVSRQGCSEIAPKNIRNSHRSWDMRQMHYLRKWTLEQRAVGMFNPLVVFNMHASVIRNFHSTSLCKLCGRYLSFEFTHTTCDSALLADAAGKLVSDWLKPRFPSCKFKDSFTFRLILLVFTAYNEVDWPIQRWAANKGMRRR